jgi:hypothetical protein
MSVNQTILKVGSKVLVKETNKSRTFQGWIIGESISQEYSPTKGQEIWEVLIDFKNGHGRKFVTSSFFKDSLAMHTISNRFWIEEDTNTNDDWMDWLTANYEYSGKGKGEEMWEETFWLSKNPTDFNIYQESKLRDQYERQSVNYPESLTLSQSL